MIYAGQFVEYTSTQHVNPQPFWTAEGSFESSLVSTRWRRCRAVAIMDAMGEVIFWLEVIWTPGLALTAYLLLPRPED